MRVTLQRWWEAVVGSVGGTRVRQAQPVHEDAVVVVERRIAALAVHDAMPCDEVVVVAYEQEPIAGMLRVERRHEVHGFPFFGEKRLSFGMWIERQADAGKVHGIEQVDQRLPCRRAYAGAQVAAVTQDRGRAVLICRTREVRRAGRIDQQHALEHDRLAALGAQPRTVAREHEEAAVVEHTDLALRRGSVRLAARTIGVVCGKTNHVVRHGTLRHGVATHVVDEHACQRAARCITRLRVLHERALEHDEEALPIRRQGHAFHALVVATAGCRCAQ